MGTILPIHITKKCFFLWHVGCWYGAVLEASGHSQRECITAPSTLLFVLVLPQTKCARSGAVAQWRSPPAGLAGRRAPRLPRIPVLPLPTIALPLSPTRLLHGFLG